MLRNLFFVAVILAALPAFVWAGGRYDRSGWNVSVGFGYSDGGYHDRYDSYTSFSYRSGGYYRPRPWYSERSYFYDTPRYYYQPPVVYAPPPVVYAPPPVVYGPPRAIYGPPVVYEPRARYYCPPTYPRYGGHTSVRYYYRH